jgi:hypothetical protein
MRVHRKVFEFLEVPLRVSSLTEPIPEQDHSHAGQGEIGLDNLIVSTDYSDPRP